MVYLFLADGFEEIEALTPVDVLRRAGAEVSTVSVTSDRTVHGAHGIDVAADVTVDDVIPEKAEMYVLPGGMPGTNNLFACDKLKELVAEGAEKGKYVAAICAAPSVIGRMGLLKGRKATCYPGFEKYLEGAEYTGAPVETDGRFITSRGMGVALDFALALCAALKGGEVADGIKASVQAR